MTFIGHNELFFYGGQSFVVSRFEFGKPLVHSGKPLAQSAKPVVHSGEPFVYSCCQLLRRGESLGQTGNAVNKIETG